MPNKLTQADVIARFKAIHGGKYDYSKVRYINNHTKVCIICPVHGEFWQTPANHFKGHGCNRCGCESTKRLIEGVGINDIDADMAKTKVYRAWRGILTRAYNAEYKITRPTYIGVEVCHSWHYLSNFKKWFDENYVEGYSLDKDILSKGRKIYSPDTCCYIPPELNNAVVNSKTSQSKKMGVHPNHGVFEVIVCKYGKRRYVGSYNSVEEAEKAYVTAKQAYVREIGDMYYKQGKISKRVYDALQSYAV